MEEAGQGEKSELFREQKGADYFPVGGAGRQFFHLRGLRIACYDSRTGVPEGIGNADPVVLLHGFCSLSYTWHEVFDEIASGQRTIAVDLKGFGASDKPADENYLLDTQAEIIAGLLDALGLERISLMGCSLGAAIALRVAQRWPQRVLKLILVSPAAFHHDQFPIWKRLVLAATRNVSTELAAQVIRRLVRTPGLIESRMRHAYYQSGTMTDERVRVYTAMLRDPHCQHAIIATLRQLDLRELEKNLPDVCQPVLILQGAYDKIIPPEFSTRLVRLLPQAELKMMACGHGPQEELPAEFVRQVNEFLAR